MTYVVTESCIRCKYTDCVDVCPVDCFREGPNFLVIDPDECIDCTLCVAECPVDAIYAEDDVPPAQQAFTALNAELSKHWKPIIELSGDQKIACTSLTPMISCGETLSKCCTHIFSFATNTTARPSGEIAASTMRAPSFARMANLRSVQKGFEKVGQEATITSDPAGQFQRCRSCMWRWPCPTFRILDEVLAPGLEPA